MKPINLQGLVEALPVIVAAITALQSGIVKAAAWMWPKFAALSSPVKVALVFLVGLPLYRIVGYEWDESLLYAGCGGAAAAMIYFFGVKRTESERIAAAQKLNDMNLAERLGEAPTHEKKSTPDHVRKDRHDG